MHERDVHADLLSDGDCSLSLVIARFRGHGDQQFVDDIAQQEIAQILEGAEST